MLKPSRVPTAGRVRWPLEPKVLEKRARPPYCSYRSSRAGRLGMSGRSRMYSSESVKAAKERKKERGQKGREQQVHSFAIRGV